MGGVQSAVYSRTGAWHCREGEKSQDVTLVTESDRFCFYGLADGQSGKPRSDTGGRESLKVLENYLRGMGIDGVRSYPFPDELPCMLMQQVRRGLLGLTKEKGGEFADYASTLLILALDPVSGAYMLAHLGDGCAVGIREGEEACLLSTPQNGLSGRETWLTTSDNAVSHFRLTFGNVENKTRILLMSDGADCLCRGRNISRQARQLMCTGTPEEIGCRLAEAEPRDDASCIVVDFARGGEGF